MDEKKIKRINELARKAKAEGMTEQERAEQAQLRRLFIESVRANVRAQLDNIDLVDEDGNIENLGEKYGKKTDQKTNP